MIQSPCINICAMDAQAGTCRGCHRTLAEITDWSRLSDTQRSQILAKVAQRRQTQSLLAEAASNHRDH